MLKGVDLTVVRGEVTCLIGPSGSGKSTLLRCINHLEKHDSGELRVDGQLVGYEARGGKLYELNDKKICDERSQIGMVFQRFNLFQNLTVLDNMTIGQIKVRGIDPMPREKKLANCWLAWDCQRRKAVSESVSGGQQQRVAIAQGARNGAEVDAV